jgi:uncharacterized protein (DUF849 family)
MLLQTTLNGDLNPDAHPALPATVDALARGARALGAG